jgi:hypothetical protein
LKRIFPAKGTTLASIHLAIVSIQRSAKSGQAGAGRNIGDARALPEKDRRILAMPVDTLKRPVRIP